MKLWRNHHSIATHASVIDQGCELEGRLTFEGTLVVNGKFRGEVSAGGTLLVGETGELEAEVQVGAAIISGLVTGNIVAQERVELKASARIYGDIITPVMILEEGVVFDGRCKMKGEGLRVVEKPALNQLANG